MKTEIISPRERGKLERRRRIRQAALEMFIEKGYDATTTREIAERADVGTGTVFVYARDKRELLMMVMNDQLDALTDEELDQVESGKSLLDQMMVFFAKRYQFWAINPELSRCAVRETFSYVKDSDELGPEILAFLARLPRQRIKLGHLIRQRQALGLVRPDLDPDMIADMSMAIYLNELRHWLANRSLDIGGGLARLRSLLHLALTGMELGTPAKPRDKRARKGTPVTVG
jgi:AcrR family transcriptional regulator